MAQLPWADIVRELSEALEAQLESALRLARRTASLEAVREAHAVRIALELRMRPPPEVDGADRPEADGLRAERDEALAALRAASLALTDTEARLAAAVKARKSAEAAVRRLRARVKVLEGAAESPPDEEALTELQRALETIRPELDCERIARSAAEAALAVAERETQELRAALVEAQQSRESQLQETRRLNLDLEAEVADLWRLLREEAPAGTTPLAPLSIGAWDGDSRAGMDRVQAKIIDARQIFKRRNHRWPLAS